MGLLQGLGHAQRLQTVFSDHAAAHPRLDADDKVGVAANGCRGKIHIEVPAIRQLVLAQQTDAGDVEQGMHPSLAARSDLLEVIHIVGSGAAGVDDGGDAGLYAHLVRLIVIDGGGGVAVGVAIDPASAHMHPAAEIQDLLRRCRLRQGADSGDFALPDGDIDELAISQPPRSDDDVVHADNLWRAAPQGGWYLHKGDREEGTQQHGSQDGTASDGLAPHVEQQRTQQGTDTDGDRCTHGGEDDEGAEEAARAVASAHHDVCAVGGGCSG